MHSGDGAGLSQRFLGETGGSEFVTLLESEMPFHNHNVMATGVFDIGDTNVATDNSMLSRLTVTPIRMSPPI